MSEEYKVPPTADETTGAYASGSTASGSADSESAASGSATSESGTAYSDNSWQEVGRQFQTLGESLAQTVRSTWESEETQRRLQEMRGGLESMVREVGKAIDESAKSPTGQKVQQDANRAAEAVRTATEQTVQEVRPQLINALQQLNDELQKLVNRMENRTTPPSKPDDDVVI